MSHRNGDKTTFAIPLQENPQTSISNPRTLKSDFIKQTKKSEFINQNQKSSTNPETQIKRVTTENLAGKQHQTHAISIAQNNKQNTNPHWVTATKAPINRTGDMVTTVGGEIRQEEQRKRDSEKEKSEHERGDEKREL